VPLVRDYHPVQWDLGTNTSEPAPFPLAKNRVDWSKVYGSWREKAWSIDASLMSSIKRTNWADIEAMHGVGAVLRGSLARRENAGWWMRWRIGNEPGDWSDVDYTRSFGAWPRACREGDPKLKIATCNLTTGKSGRYEKKSVECVAKFPQFYDVLNIHSYAQLRTGRRGERSFPEDSRLPKYFAGRGGGVPVARIRTHRASRFG